VMPEAQQLHDELLKNLGREAVQQASAAFNARRSELSRRLCLLAIAAYPNVRLTWAWKLLLCKRVMGHRTALALLPLVAKLRTAATKLRSQTRFTMSNPATHGPSTLAADGACARPRRAALQLVLASDDAYAMPLATMLRSIAESNRANWPLDVHVLTDSMPDATKARVLRSVPDGAMHLRWITVDLSQFKHLGLLSHVSSMTYARLLIPHLFPDCVSRLLYLDTDMLVQGDLAELWRVDLGGMPVGAVLDHHVDADLRVQRRTQSDDLPTVRNYFNAGVLLFDLAACRRSPLFENALAYLRAHPESTYADQDALNVAFDGRWQEIDTTWNFQNHHVTRIARLPASRRPAIVHFITSSKPWKVSSTSVNAALYDAVRSRTQFARSPAERAAAALHSFGWRVKHRLERAQKWFAHRGKEAPCNAPQHLFASPAADRQCRSEVGPLP
jgi:lipopolysaccharide biosynthesis glycosyltransferase